MDEKYFRVWATGNPEVDYTGFDFYIAAKTVQEAYEELSDNIWASFTPAIEQFTIFDLNGCIYARIEIEFKKSATVLARDL